MKRRIRSACLTLVVAVFMAGSVMAQEASNATFATPVIQQKAGMKAMMMAGKKKKGPMGCKCMMKGNEQMAGPMGCRGMMGRQIMKRMTPQQRKKFLDDTVDLRRQMVTKRFDFREALRNPETTPAELAKIERQMLELRIKMLDKLLNPASK